MTNQYLRVKLDKRGITKTYKTTNSNYLFRETKDYYQTLSKSFLKLPKTKIIFSGDNLVIKQERIYGKQLNDWLRTKNEYPRKLINRLLTSVAKSFGEIAIKKNHWVSKNLFALDASFSNFIITPDDDIFYIDLFPPRNLKPFLSGKIEWEKLLVNIPAKPNDSVMRFNIYDIRGIFSDILSHLIFYFGDKNMAELKRTVLKTYKEPIVEQILCDMRNNLDYYLKLHLSYLTYRGVDSAKLRSRANLFSGIIKT